MRPARRFGIGLLSISFISLALLHGCQDAPSPTELQPAAGAVRVLKITGGGTGDGVVTSSPAGIDCTVTAGNVSASGCKATFTEGVVVTLTASPKAGHSFVGWLGFCTGLAPCNPSMDAFRSVEARFLKGPFTITIAGGSSGTGTGRIKSQPGLTPAINCLITGGVAAATGCSAKYPVSTVLTLTAAPSGANIFSAWATPCSGTGSCQHTVNQNRTIFATFARSGTSSAAIQGKWAPAFSTSPAVGIHMHLLPTGKVLMWGDQANAQLWNPADPGAGLTSIAKAYPVYCTGHTFLPDGRLLVAGGTLHAIGRPKGDARAAVFDPVSGTWTSTASMAQGRYYPTLLALPNGSVLAVSGSDMNGDDVTIPEIGDGVTWHRLTTAGLDIPNPFYPAMFVAPNGKVFMAGFPRASRYLNLAGTGKWTFVANRKVEDRTMGSAVMYAPGKILYAGGGDPPTSSAEVIDLNGVSPAWRNVEPMHFARRQMNATLLADGQVLVTHGTSGPGFNDVTSPVFEAELWNPVTETWSLMTRESAPRTYHSTALLLPDARVLTSGSGEGGGVAYENSQFSAQVFRPPYLFDADGSPAHRPVIASAPSKISYGESFIVQTPDAASTSRGTLIRLSSVTHAFNQSQLVFPLQFAVEGPNTLSAAGPGNANLAPPGPYMLFLVNSNGVPSIAKMVTVGP